mmetsp:Transcript_950/g.2222  ORF Transcript_950/g.2222 Transcript_950/m.2222 type:complete len:185 (+) Transcript_950:98-652(+)
MHPQVLFETDEATNDENATRKAVRFDQSIDWEREAMRSVRGWESRKKRMAQAKMEKRLRKVLAYRTATVYTVASILMKSRYSDRLQTAFSKSRQLGTTVDRFLAAVEIKAAMFLFTTNTTRQERCARLGRVHKHHGRHLSNWTTREIRDLLVQLSTDPTFSSEFRDELSRGLGSSGSSSSRKWC